jgi:ATP-dependent RNA helicase DDX27
VVLQVHSMINELAKYTDIRAALVIGGMPLPQQAAELRQAPEIVVATPGRIIDHVMNTMAFELDTLSAIVLDEADRLLEMGFQDEVRKRLQHAPVSLFARGHFPASFHALCAFLQLLALHYAPGAACNV